MRRNASQDAYLHDQPKKSEIFHEKRDTFFRREWCKLLRAAGVNERVALFIAPGLETLQGCRGRFLEFAHVVHFPRACVGSEKFAKYVRVFQADIAMD